MTMNNFSDIPIGTASSEVIISYGQPYAIHKKENGMIEYEYLERIKAGARVLEERHYILVIREGKVISKHIKQSSPPAYYFDSYEMQTTQSGSASTNDDH
jgi:hypothetical protein